MDSVDEEWKHFKETVTKAVCEMRCLVKRKRSSQWVNEGIKEDHPKGSEDINEGEGRAIRNCQ